MDKQEIGFIGVGLMGTPMAKHLANSGHTLTLYDIDHDAATNAAKAIGNKASVARSPAEVAQASDIIFTMLPNGRVVQAIVEGDQGITEGLRDGALLIDTSSAEPWLTKESAKAIAAAGGSMLDAPVSGAVWGAEEGNLVFMVGGSDADVARARPLLEAMGREVFHLGGLGSGHAMKCINNSITAATLTATAEGLVAGQNYGLDPAVMVDVLNESTGGSWITQTHFHQRIFNRKFDDPFKLELMLKDVGISVELARNVNVPTPMLGLTQQLWRMADHAVGAGASVSELVRWVENQSDTQLTARKPDSKD